MDRAQVLITLLMLLIGLDGCQMLDKKRAENSLETTLIAYEKTIRWGGVAQAYSFLKPEIAMDVVAPEGLDNIRITNYEVIQPAISVNENTAVTSAAIHYLFRDRQIVNTLTDRQVWELDEESEVWYRINPIPVFK